MNKYFFKIVKLKIIDFLRVNDINKILSLFQLPLSFAPNKNMQINSLVKLATYHPYRKIGQCAVSKVVTLLRSDIHNMPLTDKETVETCSIIKPYVNANEPGLIIISFEHQLDKLLRLKSFHKLEEQYRILFMPTWQPCYTRSLLILAAKAKYPFFILPSAFSEKTLCNDNLSSLCNYLPFHAASWVNGNVYMSQAKKKTIDILMIANFSSHKRHWKLFEALKYIPNNINVVLAGVALNGRTKDSILKEAKMFGAEHRIKVIEGASDHPLKRQKGKPTIRELLSKSKLLCALTKKEGSYIGVSEALMAGTPVAMYDNAIIGTKTYINKNTGFLLNHKDNLGYQLQNILNKVNQKNPQPWAKKNISANVNSKKLNTALKEWSLQNKLSWSKDIEPFFCEHFEFKYFNCMHKEITKEYLRVNKEFGLTFSENL